MKKLANWENSSTFAAELQNKSLFNLINTHEEMTYIKLHIASVLPLHKVTLRGVSAWLE